MSESETESTLSPTPRSKVSRKKTIAVLAVVVILLVAVPLGYLVTKKESTNPPADLKVTITGKTLDKELTLTELKAMIHVEGQSSYQNRFMNWRGNGTYAGVTLQSLAELVGGMVPDDIMTVQASDNYSQNLSYNQVYPDASRLAIQGKIVLAYGMNGTDAPDWTDGPMVAVLAPDGRFSNDDFNSTACRDPEFEGSTSAGSLWVKNVDRIAIRSNEAHVLTLSDGAEFRNYSLSQLKAMSGVVTASGGFMKSTGTIVAPSEFRGVPVKDLVGAVFEGSNFSLEVVATDGYSMTYSSSQVLSGTFEHYDMNGTNLGPADYTLLLAWEQDGAPLVDMTLRLAIVGDGSPITDGHFWAKYVRNITVKPYSQGWSIGLNGLTSMTMDRQTFESVASCPYHTVSYSFTNSTGSHVYEGVPLWILVAAVDGADEPDGHYMFNSMLADAGYNVSVVASDGYAAKIPISVANGNSSIIVADKLDGEPLPASEFPLRLVGPWLSGSQKVRMIGYINLTDLQAVPQWNLTLVGTKTVTIDSMAFDALYRCGIHSVNYTFTNGTGTHTYEGIPLWVLVGAVDGEDAPGHYDLNATLLALGYSVKITATDSYSATLPSSALNDSVILAYKVDGALLSGADAPLKLVGQWLAGSQKVKSVATIELLGLP